MFQQEVAERIVAPVGTPAYGRLGVLAQWRATARIAMKVHRPAFTPPPQVMSATVHLVPATQPEAVAPALLSPLPEKGFGQRRKTLRQDLKGAAGHVHAPQAIGTHQTH